MPGIEPREFCWDIKRGRSARFGAVGLAFESVSPYIAKCGTAEFSARLASLNQILRIAPVRQRTRTASFQSAGDVLEITASKLLILSVKSDKSRVLHGFSPHLPRFHPTCGFTAPG